MIVEYPYREDETVSLQGSVGCGESHHVWFDNKKRCQCGMSSRSDLEAANFISCQIKKKKKK